ncbi:MAG: alpha/beta hydrolase, partial [Microcystaceae cyanobacterium]
PNKYLALAEGQAHVDFSQLDAGITEMIDSVDNLTLASPDLLQSFGNAVILPFFEVYIANNADFRPFLQSSYAAYVSENEQFRLFLISAASDDGLNQAIEKFRKGNREFSATRSSSP